MATNRLVVASDLTEATDPVLDKAFDLASRLDAQVTVVYVATDHRMADLREALPPDAAFTDTIIVRLEADLTEQVARVGRHDDLDVDTVVMTGNEANAVHRVASDQDAEMIVIGIRNRSRVGKLILGSTAQEILLGTPCPVLGVPV